MRTRSDSRKIRLAGLAALALAGCGGELATDVASSAQDRRVEDPRALQGRFYTTGAIAGPARAAPLTFSLDDKNERTRLGYWIDGGDGFGWMRSSDAEDLNGQQRTERVLVSGPITLDPDVPCCGDRRVREQQNGPGTYFVEENGEEVAFWYHRAWSGTWGEEKLIWRRGLGGEELVIAEGLPAESERRLSPDFAAARAPDGSYHVLFVLGDSVRYWHSGGGTFEDPGFEIGTASSDGAAPALAIDPYGTAHAVFRNASGTLIYSRPDELLSEETVAELGGGETELRIAIDRAENVFISFHDPRAGGLHLAHRFGPAGDPFCASCTSDNGWGPEEAKFVVEPVASSARVGVHHALAVEAIGIVHLAYFEPETADLMYARHGSDGWQQIEVERSGEVGEFPELAVDARGQPHIVYFDRHNRVIRYARFTRSNISTYQPPRPNPTPQPTPTPSPSTGTKTRVDGCTSYANGAKRYIACNTRLSWDDAQASCNEQGGFLADIEDEAELAFMNTLPGADNATLKRRWVGLSDRATEGTFVWVSGAPTDFTPWMPGFPTGKHPDSDCGLMIAGLQPMPALSDQACDAAQPYLCELK